MLEPEPPSPCLVGTVGRVWPLPNLRGAGQEQEGDPNLLGPQSPQVLLRSEQPASWKEELHLLPWQPVQWPLPPAEPGRCEGQRGPTGMMVLVNFV